MRDLCISFASSFFLFPVGGGSKMLEDCRDGGRGYFCWGEGGEGQYPLACHHGLLLLLQISYIFLASKKALNVLQISTEN